MKKILLILFLCSFAWSADTLCYRKGATATNTGNASGFNNSIAPTTVNRIMIFDADSATANVDISTSQTCGQIQFLNGYEGSIRTQGGNITIRPSAGKQFILNGASRNYFSSGSNGLIFITPSNSYVDTANIRASISGNITFNALAAVTGANTVIQKIINTGTGTIAIAPSVASGSATYTFIGDSCKGLTFAPGVNNVGYTSTINYAGIFDFQTINFSTNQTGTCQHNFQNAIFYCGGNLTRSTGAGISTNVGTSKFVFDSSTNTIWANINNSRTFYDMEIAKSGTAVKCSTATATDTINCNEMRITTGRLAMIAPLYCNSYLNLSTDTSKMYNDKSINTSFYRASTANASADTFKTYFLTAVNHDISCDTNITLGRFIVSAGRATALTNLRLIKFTLPASSALKVTSGKLFRIDSTFTAPAGDSLISVTSGTQFNLNIPTDSLSIYIRDANSTNNLYLKNLIGGGNNTKVNYIAYYDSVHIKNWLKQTDTIRCNWFKITSTDSAIFNKPVIVRDSIVYVAGCIPVAQEGSQIESVAGYTLTVKLNGHTTTPRVINRGGKIRWR